MKHEGIIRAPDGTTYRKLKQPGMYMASDRRGNVCGFVSEETMNNHIANLKRQRPEKETLK